MIKTTKLSNGLKIITEEVPDVHSVSVTVLIGVGSVVESKRNNGISHFVEHLIFKGTENRSAKLIAQSIEDYGGSLNAFTEKELTCYYARVLTDQVLLTIDIFCDMLLNSLFDKNELELERQVILEEIKMYEDTPDEIVYDNLFKAIWGDNSLAFPVTGTFDSVSNMSRKQIVSFVKGFYAPDNILFSLSGNFKTEEVINKIKSHFDDLKPESPNCDMAEPVMKPDVTVQVKDIEQAHVCIATKGVSITSLERYPLTVLDIALAGGISSRLFQEVREKRGLAYSISSYKALYRPVGVFGIYAGTGVNNIEEVLKIIVDEFAKVKDEGLFEDELVRAKKQLKGSLLLSLESMYYRSYRNAHSEIYFNKIFSVEEVCEYVDRITMEDVNALTKVIFDPDYYSLSIVGPKSVSKEYSLVH